MEYTIQVQHTSKTERDGVWHTIEIVEGREFALSECWKFSSINGYNRSARVLDENGAVIDHQEITLQKEELREKIRTEHEEKMAKLKGEFDENDIYGIGPKVRNEPQIISV